MAGHYLTCLSQARHGVGASHHPAVLHEYLVCLASTSGSAAKKVAATTPSPQPRSTSDKKNNQAQVQRNVARFASYMKYTLTPLPPSNIITQMPYKKHA